MNHSDIDNTLSLPADTSLAPNEVNRTPLATPRCPIPHELDDRGAIVPSTVASRILQTVLTLLLPFDGPRTENSKDHPPSRPCLSIPPDLISEALGHTQPLTRRALRCIRRDARRTADVEFPFPAADHSKTILPTVAAPIYNTHIPPKYKSLNEKMNTNINIALPIPSQICTHPANFPCLPRIHEPTTDGP